MINGPEIGKIGYFVEETGCKKRYMLLQYHSMASDAAEEPENAARMGWHCRKRDAESFLFVGLKKDTERW